MISWDEKYNLGIPQIDIEHGQFIRIINRLERAITESREEKEVENIFTELNNYSKFHFSTEEQYFEKFKYPEAATHIKEHDFFRKTVKEIYEDLAVNHNLAALRHDLPNFLGNWFINHVQGTDRRYVPFFHEHGL